jgi:hypothetical protein
MIPTTIDLTGPALLLEDLIDEAGSVEEADRILEVIHYLTRVPSLGSMAR